MKPRQLLLMLAPLFLGLACAEPPLVRTTDELSRNIGKKVAVEGTYEIERTGEHVRSGELDVMLDVPPDAFSWGHPAPPEGALVRATGVVKRGSMAMGMFIDEETLELSRRNVGDKLVSGFVLRSAKLEQVEGRRGAAAGPTTTPATQPAGGER
jgi:hypothetical protein